MDFAVLILSLSFITVVCYLVSYTIRNMCKHKDNKIRRSSYGFTKEKAKEISDRTELGYKNCYTLQPYTTICNEAFYKALMYKDGSDVQDKYKETLPKHSTRIKLREARKLRNKHKEKKLKYMNQQENTSLLLILVRKKLIGIRYTNLYVLTVIVFGLRVI